MKHEHRHVIRLAATLAEQIVERVEDLGLVLKVRGDMAAWADFYRATPVGFVNPAFDPEHCRVDAGNAFWVEVATPAGEPVACTAAKRHESRDLRDDLAFCRLWLERRPPTEAMPLVLPEDLPLREGRFQHYGGLWVDSRWRGQGLSACLPRLARAISVSRWQPDWHIGWTLGDVGRSRLPRHYYGYARLAQATDGCLWPPSGKPESCFLPWESAGLWADAARRQIAEAASSSRHAALRPAPARPDVPVGGNRPSRR